MKLNLYQRQQAFDWLKGNFEWSKKYETGYSYEEWVFTGYDDYNKELYAVCRKSEYTGGRVKYELTLKNGLVNEELDQVAKRLFDWLDKHCKSVSDIIEEIKKDSEEYARDELKELITRNIFKRSV